MMFLHNLRDKTFVLIAISITISITLSIILLLQDNVVNNDGVTYLVAAEKIKAGDWGKALQIYNWPFYPWLIASTSSVTALSLEYSAYALNIFFVCIIVAVFILISKEIRNNYTYIVIAALVILIFPSLNDYRSFIIRDLGYLGFYLLAIYFFILYTEYKEWHTSILWSVSMIIASLFRIEGMVFLFLMPLIIFLDKKNLFTRKLGVYLKANAVLASVILISSGLLFFTNVADIVMASRLSDPVRVLGELVRSHTAEISEKSSNLEHYVLNKYTEKYSTAIIYGSLFLILLMQIFKTLTPINTILAALSIYKGQLRKLDTIAYLWIWIIILNILILSIFILRYHFLVGRFPLGLSIVLMLIIPLFLERMYKHVKEHGLDFKKKIVSIVLTVILLLYALDGIVITGTSKNYVKQAGQWYASNIGFKKNYFSNSSIFSYYAGQITDSRSHYDYNSKNLLALFQNKKWKKLDYLVIKIARKEKKMKQYIDGFELNPVKEFSNKRGDVIRIYKLSG